MTIEQQKKHWEEMKEQARESNKRLQAEMDKIKLPKNIPKNIPIDQKWQRISDAIEKAMDLINNLELCNCGLLYDPRQGPCTHVKGKKKC